MQFDAAGRDEIILPRLYSAALALSLQRKVAFHTPIGIMPRRSAPMVFAIAKRRAAAASGLA